MKRKYPIYLLTPVRTKNDIGDTIEDYNRRFVLAEKKSIRQSEFYQAYAAGLRPEITFVVWTAEYKNERNLEYEGDIYEIIRTYDIDEKNTELVCRGLVNRANAEVSN